MGKEFNIPIRPISVVKGLSIKECDALTWYVLRGCTKEESFRLFINPALNASSQTLKRAADQFFDSQEAQEYLSKYKMALDEWCSVFHNGEHSSSEHKASADEIKERKAAALSRLTDYILHQADNIESSDSPDDIIKFADRIGIFDSNEEIVEAPRRYLPESCSHCEYKNWIEANCKITKD